MKVKEIINVVKPCWIQNEKYDTVQPKVTVILPTYTRVKSGNFEKTVESIINQRYKSWELIIVDDASTDGTFDLIKFYMVQDSRISCIRHTNNLGLPSISEYEGYVKARGEYIAFAFDDSVWDENHLMLSMKAMLVHRVMFTYGIVRSYTCEKNHEDISHPLELLPVFNTIGNSTVVMKKSIIEDVGFYDPHLSLTELYCWDLWCRVSKRFRMYKINCVVTSKYSVSWSESAGDTADIGSWVASERMHYSRNDELKPTVFLENDIVEIRDDSSELLAQYVESCYSKYNYKKWWEPQEKIFVSNKNHSARILVVLPMLGATYSLGFDALSERSIMKITTFAAFNEQDVVYADAVIFVRDTVAAVKFAKSLKRYKIPIYYYVDDNFVVIFENNDDKTANRELFSIVKCWNRATMTCFDKILVSTEALKEYFVEKNLHDDVSVLPPSIFRACTCMSVSDKLTIGFMGGVFREKSFIDYIFPAILKLSAKVQVKLVCPDTLAQELHKCFKEDKNVTIVGIPRDNDYFQVMCRYSSERIQILIHSGDPSEKNNKYKTKNAMINSNHLGAVLVTSAVQPYLDEKTVITCNNNVSAWFECLNSLTTDVSKREKYFKMQTKYVEENYTVAANGSILYQIFADLKISSFAEIINKYELYISELNRKNVSTISADLSEYDFIDKMLDYFALRRSYYSFVICPQHKTFTKLGLIFSAVDTHYSGIVTAELYDDKKKIISRATFSLDDLLIRQYNYFVFSNELKSCGKMTLKLITKYNSGSGTIGIYVNSDKNSFVNKVYKKIMKKHLPICNLIHFVTD